MLLYCSSDVCTAQRNTANVLYRGLRVLKNKDVSNMILIFYSNFRVWGFFVPNRIWYFNRRIWRSLVPTSGEWLLIYGCLLQKNPIQTKNNKAKHCNPHWFSCHVLSVTRAALSIYRDTQTESSNLKSFKLCFKYLAKEKNALLLGFCFREMQEKH